MKKLQVAANLFKLQKIGYRNELGFDNEVGLVIWRYLASFTIHIWKCPFAKSAK